MVGIIQEQHPDRCKLFMQWKQMDWPIMVDSLNELEVQVVPITLFIDEYGIIQGKGRRASSAAEAVKKFLSQTFYPPGRLVSTRCARPDLDQLKKSTDSGSATSWRNFGTSLVNWAGPERYGEAINAFEKALTIEPEHGLTHFQYGVALRKRYDSAERMEKDFQNAANEWSAALDINPNQYIWRRRIQQYGPRLMKPYPFYDWVHQARKDIAARGETPHELLVEPSGAEFAQPERSFSAEATQQENPDPLGRIDRDQEGFISVEIVVVPATVQPGKAVRVHIQMRPNASIKAHWNNEADDTEMWIDPPAGWEIDRRRHKVGIPPDAAVSLETRTIEFELMVPDDAEPGEFTLPAYALYYVCEGINGVCLFRRQDLSITVTVVK